MKKPMPLGTRSFRTQKEALEHFRPLQRSYEDEQRISNQAGHLDLVALTERYDGALLYVGETTRDSGQIAHFERRLSTGTGWRSSGFWVICQNGAETVFSYIDAAKGKPKSRLLDFYAACREAEALNLVLTHLANTPKSKDV